MRGETENGVAHEQVKCPRQYLRKALVSLVSLLVLAWVVGRLLVFDFYRVPSGSMRPNFSTGSYIVTSDIGYGRVGIGGFLIYQGKTRASAMTPGEVYAFAPPRQKGIYMKRLIGLPGDVVKTGAAGVFVNGRSLRVPSSSQEVEDRQSPERKLSLITERKGGQEYLIQLTQWQPSNRRQPYTEKEQSFVVPENHYFFMGDNRRNSLDSRMWGFVPAENISGRVIYSFFGDKPFSAKR